MPLKCSAYGCKNYLNMKTAGISFHRFPKGTRGSLQRESWIKAMRVEDWEPRKHSVLCSLHFEEHFFNRTLNVIRLKDDAIPTIFSAFPSYLKKKAQSVRSPQKCTTETIPEEVVKLKQDLAKLRLKLQQQRRRHKTVIESRRLCRKKIAAFDSIRREIQKTNHPDRDGVDFPALAHCSADNAKSEPGESPEVASNSDSDDELLKPKEEVDSDREDSDEGMTFSFQPHHLYRNAVNLVESPTGAAVVDSSSKCCVVPDCLSKSRRLFNLPQRAWEPCGAWLELMPWLPDGTGVAEVVLCSRHFSRDDLTPAGLHVDAVPTMNLPDPLSDAWPTLEGKVISNGVVTTSAKLRELGETRPGISTTFPGLRSKDRTDPPIKIEPELQENPLLYSTSITPAPNIKLQSFFEHAAIADYMQPNTSTSSYPVGPNLNVPGVNNLSFMVQPMDAKPAIHGSWEVPLLATNSQATTSMSPPVKKSKLTVIKKVSQRSESENLKRVIVKKRKASSVEVMKADDMPLVRFIRTPCILCEGKCKYKMTISHQDLKDKIFKCFGIKLIANHKFEMCEGCLSQLKNAEYFRTKVHIVNEQISKEDIMNHKVGNPPLETEEPVKPVIQLSEKETQTNEPPKIYDHKDLSNFRILFDEEVDPRNLVDSPAFLRMSSDICKDGLSLCKKRILIMTDKQQPPKLTPLENTTFSQKFHPLYESSEYQKFQPAFESRYKKTDLPPPPPLPPMVGDMYMLEHVKPVQVEKPLIYTEGHPPTRMGRKSNLTKVYVCNSCHEKFLDIQLLKTHVEGHKTTGEQQSNIPTPASRPNPNLFNPGPSREFGHIDHHR